MVISLLADINVIGQVEAVVLVAAGPAWHDVWTAMEVRVLAFRQIGLNREIPDDQLWDFCQANQIVLVTANRNSKGPTSLEQTIRSRRCRYQYLRWPIPVVFWRIGSMQPGSRRK